MLLGLTGWLIQIGKGYPGLGLSKIQITKSIFKYMFIYSGKFTYTYMFKEPPVIKTREELKKVAAKEEYKNLIFQSCSTTEED